MRERGKHDEPDDGPMKHEVLFLSLLPRIVPPHSITILVPFPPDGGPDMIARVSKYFVAEHAA